MYVSLFGNKTNPATDFADAGDNTTRALPLVAPVTANVSVVGQDRRRLCLGPTAKGRPLEGSVSAA